MTMIEQIKRDREAGTPGPWMARWPVGPEHPFMDAACNHAQKPSGGDYYMSVSGICEAPDARRIVRAPDMEAALLAADELARMAARMLVDHYDNRVDDALAAYRKATKGDT